MEGGAALGGVGVPIQLALDFVAVHVAGGEQPCPEVAVAGVVAPSVGAGARRGPGFGATPPIGTRSLSGAHLCMHVGNCVLSRIKKNSQCRNIHNIKKR